MDLQTYFSKHWKQDTSYKYSSNSLINKVNDLNPKNVLDIGCGENYFKGKIQNLYGIDPYNDNADQKIPIEEVSLYKTYDVILALGSINFGDEPIIDRQMRAIDRVLETDGHLFMRLNPGLDHYWTDTKEIKFYPWSKEKIKHFAIAYGYHI